MESIKIVSLTSILNDQLGHPCLFYPYPIVYNSSKDDVADHAPRVIDDVGVGRRFSWVVECVEDEWLD